VRRLRERERERGDERFRRGRAESEEAGGGRSTGRTGDKEAGGGIFTRGGREMLAEAEERVAAADAREWRTRRRT
jgi:hypothetical protein